MKAYGVVSLDRHSLSASEFFQLMTESKEAVAVFVKAEKLENLYTVKNQELASLLETYQSGLHQSRASQVSAKLEQADRERDDALRTLTALVRAYSRVKVAATKEAYDLLAQLLKGYAGLTTATYEKETEGINHLLQELKKAPYQTALTSLHLDVHVTNLTSAQRLFEKAYKERLTELKGKTPSQSRELRSKLQETYDFLVDFTALQAYAFPAKKQYSDLRDQLNAIRSRYKKHKAGKKAEKEVPKVLTKDMN